MDLRTFGLIFGTVFLAELGDKTQLATMLFAAKGEVSKWLVFGAAAAALVVAAGMGTLAGDAISRYVAPRMLTLVAGIGFMLIGAWTLWGALRAA